MTAAKRAELDPDAIITVLVENPRRAGSATHERFELYRTGMKVSTFIAKGGWTGDLRWDLERGHIKLASPRKR